MLARVLDATERNSVLAGPALRSAADAVAVRANRDDLYVIASDEAGERMIGAALMTRALRLVDRSRRVDGQSILIVSGWVAGSFDIQTLAERMRSLGAADVHAIVLNGAGERIEGCNTVTVVHWPTRPALVA